MLEDNWLLIAYAGNNSSIYTPICMQDVNLSFINQERQTSLERTRLKGDVFLAYFSAWERIGWVLEGIAVILLSTRVGYDKHVTERQPNNLHRENSLCIFLARFGAVKKHS